MRSEGRQDWWVTIRQSLPRFWRIARQLRPTYELRNLAEVDEEFLQGARLRGLIWDVDGTLTHYHGAAVAPEIRDQVDRLLGHGGLRHVIVSNCDDARLEELGRMFPSLPVLKMYEGNGQRVLRRLEAGVETWSDASGSPWSGDGVRLRPVRKPDGLLTESAVRELGIDPSHAAMIGDQYWTDVAGANLASVRSIRIPTVGRGTFPWPLRVFQALDEWLRWILG